MVAGAAIGSCAPACVIRTLNSFGGTFGQFIKFIVPFIIVALVTPAIAEAGRSAGRLLLLTMCLAYASTLLAGSCAFGVAKAVFPSFLDGSLDASVAAKEFPAYFKLAIPPVMGVTTAMVTAFMFGLVLAARPCETLARAFAEMKEVVTATIAKAVVPLLPFYILTVIADLAASGRLLSVGGSCLKIMGAAFAMTTAILLVQYALAGAVTRRNPLKALWTMLPAYLTGWGCCSSAATIPVTLRQVRKNGVSDETANLVIPLCANVHLAGSMANMVIYAAGLTVLAGGSLPFGAYTEYILMVSVTTVASPGVPGGVVLACASIAEAALGFSPERYAIMIAVYMALDGMGTACNLTGDGAIAMLVDRFRGRTGSAL
jgi:Na+/H+-dicarboxylate symporter